MHKVKLFTLIFLFANANLKAQFSQQGQLDTTFNSADKGFGKGDGPNTSVFKSIFQQDGKLIIVGAFTRYNGISRNGIARLNIDGSLDTSFNPGSGMIGTGTEIPIMYSVALQTDGKIIIGGNFISFNGTARNRVARLNSNGSIDSAFNSTIGANNTVTYTALQTDGKIVIGGFFSSYNGVFRNSIARINSDGSLDTTFNPGLGTNNGIKSIAIQPDGKMIIGGFFTSYNSIPRSRITRINSNGSLDTSFNPGSGASGTVHSITLQPDGKSVIGGDFYSYNNTIRSCIARININGSIDTTFNQGIGLSGWPILTVYATTIQPDGKVIIGGTFTSFDNTPRNNIARLNSNGSLDPSFETGTGTDDLLYSASLQADGKLVITGNFASYRGSFRNVIARLNSNGTLDNTFNPGNGVNALIYSIGIQSDGKTLIGGDFRGVNGTFQGFFSRLNSNGSLDTSFQQGIGANNSVRCIAQKTDGKILIGGHFTRYNNQTRNYLTQLNSNGSLDTTASLVLSADYHVFAIDIQPNGKVVVGGDFFNINSISRRRIARLDTNGSVDLSFNSGVGPNFRILTVASQPDGKIVIGGRFTEYSGTPRIRIARVNSNGSLDTTFNSGLGATGTSFNEVATIKLLTNGKLLIGGNFTSYNGTPTNHFARLNSNGSLDTTFNNGTGPNNRVFCILLQPDGKIIIGGTFTSYNGIPINRIARINSDGSLDMTFNPGVAANSTVVAASFQPDGNLIIGGDFTSYNGIGRNRIARIWGGNTVAGVGAETLTNNIPFVYPNPTQAFIQVKVGRSFSYTLHSIHGVLLDQGVSNEPEVTLHTNAYRSGTYLLRVVTSEGISVQKFIKE